MSCMKEIQGLGIKARVQCIKELTNCKIQQTQQKFDCSKKVCVSFMTGFHQNKIRASNRIYFIII